jgi:soluble lytic murein transglycosylase
VEVGKLERSEFDSRELVRLIRLLGALDERRYVRSFLLHLRRQAETPEEHQLQVELALSIARTDQAILTAKQADRQGMGSPGHLYPVPSLVRTHLDDMASPEPALVLALIRQESAFDHKAVSRAGARGLMQLMPATARLVARQTGGHYTRAMLTEDPAANLRLGRAYLEKLLQDYGGSAVLALAAYNAGPNRADRWIKDFGDPRRPDVDAVDWIEQIPFNETRNYVQRVLEGQVVYRLALSGQRRILPLSMASTAFDRVY